MKLSKVAVVGGGLAGLSAAYQLLLQGQHEVHVFEATKQLGGRVISLSVNHHLIDFGGFLIYPWYTETHKLISDLNLDSALRKTPASEIYYILDASGRAYTEATLPISKREYLQLWSKAIFKLIQKNDLSWPDLKRFESKTMAAYLRSILGTKRPGVFETFADTVNQGYCYGPITHMKAAFMAPIVRQMQVHGDIRSTSFFPNGTAVLVDQLSQHIKQLGGHIHLNSPVSGVNGLTLKIHGRDTAFHSIVFAQTVAPDLYKQILPKVKAKCTYTQFITAAIQVSSIPVIDDVQTWGAVFYASKQKLTQQILSVVNLESLYGPKLANTVMINCIVRRAKHAKHSASADKKLVLAELKRLYPHLKASKVLQLVHWDKAMPISEEKFVASVRQMYGQDGYFFAGDFLGAPSMETAIASGLRAAKEAMAVSQT